MTKINVRYSVVTGYPAYRVGSDGSIWCCLKRGGHERILTNNWRILKLSLGKNNYPQVTMYDVNGRMTTKKVHRLVLESFVGLAPLGMVACHENGNPQDNKL